MDASIQTLVELALAEDLQDIGDLTSLHFVHPDHQSLGRIISREDAVISGIDIASYVSQRVDPDLEFTIVTGNGSAVKPGDTVCEIKGKTQSILTAERTVLNFMQRLSGIATVTRSFTRLVEHTSAKILDTRKTTPGWRALEKAAVLDGGGVNHRMGLYDAVMVKDNHLVANPKPIDLAESIAELKKEMPKLKIEVEADHLSQVESFLSITGIDVILLDNMSNDELRTAVSMRDKAGSKIQLEASGGVNLDTVTGIAETGVDFISIGALTHSVRSIDLGLDLQNLDAQ